MFGLKAQINKIMGKYAIPNLYNRRHSKEFYMAKKLSFPPIFRQVFTLIPMGIRFCAFLDWNKNLSFLSHKNLSE